MSLTGFALEVKQLTVNYGNIPVLWDISVQIPKGVMVGVIGPNGAGKSTLVKSALGLVSPLSGKVEFFGQPLKTMRQHIAYVPQRESVDWEFPVTVRDLVVMGRYGKLGILKKPREADWIAVDHCLETVGMSAYATRQISQLSGGQQQRAFIARALLQEADIYFLDEPFAGIDIASETMIVHLIQKLRDKGKTIFVVHHDLNTVEHYFDWTILLNLKLIASGPVEESFTPKNLMKTYGKNYALLDAALKRAQQKSSGEIN